jgi:hypothetical protein
MGDSTGTILIFSVVVGLAGAAYWYFNQERRKTPNQMGCLESKLDPAEVLPSRVKFLHVFASQQAAAYRSHVLLNRAGAGGEKGEG